MSRGSVREAENLTLEMRCAYFFGWEEVNGFRGK